MNPPIIGRVLQFRAGPHECRFFACLTHRAILDGGDADLFFGTVDKPVFPLDRTHVRDYDIECDFCREG